MMNATWPDTLRTVAYVFAQPMSVDNLEPFYLSPGLVPLLGREARADKALGSLEELAEALAEEYTRLFVGPYHHFPPTEGLARGDDQLLGDQALEVQLAYGSSGYEARVDLPLLADHISVELDFVATLLERDDWEAARGFVRAHPAVWVPGWVFSFSSHARYKFYPAMGSALCGSLKQFS